MSDWAHGYNVERGYTYNSFKEVSPEWLDFSASLNGYAAPDRSSGFRYLELGSGQGFGLCLLAACYPESEFIGVDFNPEHIAHSRALAAKTGLSNIRFVEGDFAEMSTNWPADFGKFHYVVLHGIYTWIPAAVRPALVKCLDHATEPGALVYVSYNAMPGWAASMPLQHITRRLQLATASPGATAIKQAQQLFETMEAAGAALFKAYPGLKVRLQSNKTQDPAYLVHEYLHDEWHPLWFSQVSGEFAGAKLAFVGSATLAENYLKVMLPEASRKLIERVVDPALQQEIIDCAINQSFRRDIFCRGPRREFGGVRSSANQPLALIKQPETEPLTIKTAFGGANITPAIQKALVRELSEGPKTIQQLHKAPELKGSTATGLTQAVALMVHGGYLMPVPARSAASASTFNSALTKLTVEGAPYHYVAAPTLGNSMSLGWTDMVLLNAYLTHRNADPTQLGVDLSKCMSRLGRSFLKDGKPIDTAEAKAEQTRNTVQQFVERLSAWKQQGIID